MNKIELQVNGKTLIFTNESVSYASHKFYYAQMSNIAHRGGEQPAYIFDYDGKRLALPYDPKDEAIVNKLFTIIAGQIKKYQTHEKNSTEATGTMQDNENSCVSVDDEPVISPNVHTDDPQHHDVAIPHVEAIKHRQKWYLQTWLIALLFALWFLVIPLIAGIVLLIFQTKQNRELHFRLDAECNQIQKAKNKLNLLTLEQVQEEIEATRLDFTKEKARLQNEIAQLISSKDAEKEKLLAEMTFELRRINDEIANAKSSLNRLNEDISERSETLQKAEKSLISQTRKLARTKELYKAAEYALNAYMNVEPTASQILLTTSESAELEELVPTVTLKLHCMDIKELRKAYRENDKQITKILEQYSSRYTTKANRAIYNLMVIALRAELQNILHNLKYEKLDTSVESVTQVTQKYLHIAGEGNQSIAGTLAKFIGEVEYLFTNAVKIEYNYYVKKEQAKQEQAAIRAQMKQEAEERKALATERAKVEEEERKYHTEIEKISEQMESGTPAEIEMLQKRILELQAQLADVTVKKEEIVNLQNVKAGNVYIISNLGSFGDNVFKIGMTRRLDPQDRVNELGDASVPFKFDVHSFIFSENAVDLENKLHQILDKKRLNKVNLRKEFFNVTIDELETLVNDLAPSAEFNRTMLAEEFRQSISADTSYASIQEVS